jgi:LysR family glycine cleavage system transcriptional activator
LKRGDIPSIGGLTSFVAAAQHGSFTRAADELSLSQGAISRQIREIESQLGIRLFERIRQRVVLTEAGKLYLSQVRKALNDLADATRRIASFNNGTTLHLIAPPTFGARWVVPRLSGFHSRNPAVMINVTSQYAPNEFAVESFDAAVLHKPSHLPATISHYLMDVEMVAVSSPKLGARRAVKTPTDLARFPLLHKVGRASRWTEWMAGAGVTLDGPLHGHSYETFAMIVEAAIAGHGIGLLPYYLIADDLASRRLEIIGREFVDFRLSYYLVLPEARAGLLAIRSFAFWLIEEARKFNVGNARPAVKKDVLRRPSGRTAFAAGVAARSGSVG